MRVRYLRKRAVTIFLNNSLLITRPLQESLVFSRQVHKLNNSISTICAPLFEIESIEVKKDLSDVTSLIVTSSNAIRSLKQSQVSFKGPIFCVGDSTALVAKKEGFYSISLGRDSSQLLTLIQKTISNEIEKLVYFRGEEVVADLTGLLRNQNYNIDEVICYRKSSKKLPHKIIEAINRNTIVGATFFSKQTVNLFSNNVAEIPDGFLAFCISEEVARTVSSVFPKCQLNLRTAKLPTIKEMCKLVIVAPELAN